MPSNTIQFSLADFRLLAAADPLAAKRQFLGMLGQDIAQARDLMTAASGPGDGRVRQLIANVLRGSSHAAVLSPVLVQWAAVETDEFARRSIETALPAAPAAPSPAPQARIVGREVVEAYRYASGRIRHQFRNALMEPQTALLRMDASAGKIADPSVRSGVESQIAALRDGLDRLGRIVEADLGDGFFEVRPLALGAWIQKFSAEYASRYRAIPLRLIDPEPTAKIRGSEHLLSTIFWNMWINAYQAIGAGCEITVSLSVGPSQVWVLVRDNGEGLAGVSETAFRDVQPRAGHRGRGLLEVQDAVDQLHGTAELVVVEDGSYRVQLTFPREIL